MHAGFETGGLFIKLTKHSLRLQSLFSSYGSKSLYNITQYSGIVDNRHCIAGIAGMVLQGHYTKFGEFGEETEDGLISSGYYQ
jgi:hypothetical protein